MGLFCTRRCSAEDIKLLYEFENTTDTRIVCIKCNSNVAHQQFAHVVETDMYTYLWMRCAVRSHRLSFIQFGSCKSQVIIYMRIGASFFSSFYYFAFRSVMQLPWQCLAQYWLHRTLPAYLLQTVKMKIET